MPPLAAAIQATAEPPIPAVRHWAARDRGHELLDLTQAVPGYPAHPRLARPAGRCRIGGLICLPGPFFGSGQERQLRLAFANAEPARIAELPARLA